MRIVFFCSLLILIGCNKELFTDSGTFTDSRDSLVYKWVSVGNQTWMAQNLAYLPAVFPPSESGYQESYYWVSGYEGNSVEAAVSSEIYKQYGVLYNWKAVQTACPAGWHLPSDEEWKELEAALGMDPSTPDNSDFQISGAVGEKLKSTSDWLEEGNGNNYSGLDVLPGGSRNRTGEFGGAGMFATFRTSSASGSSGNISRVLSYESVGISRGSAGHDIGLSARCIKNE
ncbi:MAG: hypothetical protein A2X22_07035 [Bacteroidetes bacterium GWF2_49_14]|nr:MAG: hypothetical protein A2X22_07035 [Bacteroidetes bacterium GWF2_49_14]HBB91120.1 hypothetical protein [Bacteroidales bacterium]